jgi:hypothetical protein
MAERAPRSEKTSRVVANDEVARGFVAGVGRQNSLDSPNCNCRDYPSLGLRANQVGSPDRPLKAERGFQSGASSRARTRAASSWNENGLLIR